MMNLMKQLGMGLGVVFTLGVSSTAMAYPPQCVEICTCNSSCATPCYYGMEKGHHCSEEACVGSEFCPAAMVQVQSSSAQGQRRVQEPQDDQEPQDASQEVCTEPGSRAVVGG